MYTQAPEVLDNREHFINFCLEEKMNISNTWFQKEDKQLCTFIWPKTRGERKLPYIRDRYETLDYWLTQQKWKNSVINCEADPDANLDTDHYPLIATIRVKLKAKQQQERKRRAKYSECSQIQRFQYNKDIIKIIAQKKEENIEIDTKQIAEILTSAGNKNIPKIYAKSDKIGISDKLYNLIMERGQALLREDHEEVII